MASRQLFRSYNRPVFSTQETRLSLTNRATHCVIRNSVADSLKHSFPHINYHAEFGNVEGCKHK